jgi:siroheme synthase (precorrin-2 oxidase/ferrochelatase)
MLRSAVSPQPASGTVALVGSGSAALVALRQLRSAGANVHWFSTSADVVAEVLMASAPPGRLELSFADPRQADFSGFSAVVTAAGDELDGAVAARARTHDVPVHAAGRLDAVWLARGGVSASPIGAALLEPQA